LLPETVPTPRNNPSPKPHTLEEVEFLSVLHGAFGGHDDELHSVQFEVRQKQNELERRTIITGGGEERRVSNWTAIRRG
jgi:hypothetical protein